MADDLKDTIRENAQGPAKAAGDAGSVEQHKVTDQIEADKFLTSKEAAKSKRPASMKRLNFRCAEKIGVPLQGQTSVNHTH